MFAVIRTGGKQYRVAAEDVITVERLPGAPGDVIELADVLMLGGDTVTVGSPLVAGASVAGEVVRESRGDKVIAFKKRRRQNSRRKRGHRQEYTVLRITEILTDGRKPTVRERTAVAATEAEGAPPTAEPAETAESTAETAETSAKKGRPATESKKK